MDLSHFYLKLPIAHSSLRVLAEINKAFGLCYKLGFFVVWYLFITFLDSVIIFVGTTSVSILSFTFTPSITSLKKWVTLPSYFLAQYNCSSASTVPNAEPQTSWNPVAWDTAPQVRASAGISVGWYRCSQYRYLPPLWIPSYFWHCWL